MTSNRIDTMQYKAVKKRNPARTTLRSLANQLNIHVSTVSRVLNGTAEDARSAASEQVIERIRRLAQQENYRPNHQAIGLRTRKTKMVGVLVPKLSDIVVATIYEGIDAAAKKHNYFTFVSSTYDIPERQEQLAEAMLAHNVEGLIIADSRMDTTAYMEQLRARDIHVVLVSRRAPGYTYVVCDDYKGGQLAAEHLLSLGHKKVAVLSGEPYTSTGVDRTAGFIDYCASRGVTIPAEWIVNSAFDTRSGRIAADALLSAAELPTAIFAVNDFIGIGLMGALRDRGIRPGEQMAVIGYNDTPLAAELPVSMSSIQSQMHNMGYRGMEFLINKLNGQHPDPELLEPTLIVRESSGPSLHSK